MSYVQSGMGVLSALALGLFLACGSEWAKSRAFWEKVGVAVLFAAMSFILLGIESEPHVSEMEIVAQ
jgi:hypothetical protein